MNLGSAPASNFRLNASRIASAFLMSSSEGCVELDQGYARDNDRDGLDMRGIRAECFECDRIRASDVPVVPHNGSAWAS
jgi:hypothetical protein